MIKGGNLTKKEYVEMRAKGFAKSFNEVLSDKHFAKAEELAEIEYPKYKMSIKTEKNKNKSVKKDKEKE